jgi:hypothetical protein
MTTPAGDTAWPAGSYYLPEIMGPGVAVFDYDGDGHLDLLQLRSPPPGQIAAPAPNRLFRGDGAWGFADVSASSGLDDPGFGQAVAIGDIDNDGDLDVYFANFGRDALYRNNGDGSFTGPGSVATADTQAWSSSATFCDYDGDADLDLYVVHYLEIGKLRACRAPSGVLDYCGPQQFDGVTDTLYRNDGDGGFHDVTAEAGLILPDGGRAARGLGVVCVDLSGDGLPDFYVANDGEPNQLWVNRGDGRFVDEAMIRGLAVNRRGHPEASMGLAVGDVDRDGRIDLFMTHLAMESNTLYLTGKGPLFADRSLEAGLAHYDLPFTGFGCALVDFDLDGDLDLAVVNGRVRRDTGAGPASGDFWEVYAEPNLLFDNDGQGGFSDTGTRGGRFVTRREVSRGLATGDIDGDGDVDVAMTNVDNTLRLYRNDAPSERVRRLGVRAVVAGRDALGARLTLHTTSGDHVRGVIASSSYQSSSDPSVLFGLGDSIAVQGLEVRWSDGGRERFAVGDVERTLVVRRGEGRTP